MAKNETRCPTCDSVVAPGSPEDVALTAAVDAGKAENPHAARQARQLKASRVNRNTAAKETAAEVDKIREARRGKVRF